MSCGLLWQQTERVPVPLCPPCPGYIIYYSTDVNAEIHDWVIEPVVGNRLTHQIQELTLDTPYFFKIQARNSKGMGPMSEAVQFRTPKGTWPCSPWALTFSMALGWPAVDPWGCSSALALFHRAWGIFICVVTDPGGLQ